MILPDRSYISGCNLDTCQTTLSVNGTQDCMHACDEPSTIVVCSDGAGLFVEAVQGCTHCASLLEVLTASGTAFVHDRAFAEYVTYCIAPLAFAK